LFGNREEGGGDSRAATGRGEHLGKALTAGILGKETLTVSDEGREKVRLIAGAYERLRDAGRPFFWEDSEIGKLPK